MQFNVSTREKMQIEIIRMLSIYIVQGHLLYHPYFKPNIFIVLVF